MNTSAPATPLTRRTLSIGVSKLAAVDHDLSVIASTHGEPPMWARRPTFATLIRIILEQQVTLASGAAAYRRLSTALGKVTPHKVLGRPRDELRRLGLTRQKTRYCHELARAVVEDGLDLAALRHASADDVRSGLTRIVGIGRWTADVYLVMALRRPDVWPHGDLALYQALREITGRQQTTRQLDELALRWRPWRAVAARMLWHHYLRTRRGARVGGPEASVSVPRPESRESRRAS